MILIRFGILPLYMTEVGLRKKGACIQKRLRERNSKNPESNFKKFICNWGKSQGLR